jgi:aminopeptidase N
MKQLCVLGVLLICAITAGAQQMPYQGSYELLRKAEAGNYRVEANMAALLDSTHSYDVTFYLLRLDLNETSDNIRKAQTTIQGIARANLDSVELDFISLTVDSAKYNGTATVFHRQSGKLRVMTPQLGQNQPFSIDIFYHGFPARGLFFTTTRYGDDHTYTSTEPSDARYWFPCFDEPWDKADSCEIFCTTGTGRTAVANGRLIEVINEGGGRFTYHWKESHPISTYLMSISVAAYAVINDFAHVGNDTIAVQYYAYHQDSADVAYDLGNTPDMIEFYSGRIVPYAFANEKYAVVQSSIFNGWGAMENQTNTTYGDNLINGNRTYEWIDAHELAHMWFGDMVTCGDWRNIWLNESFATYFDALYTEYKYGYAAFQQRRVEFFGSYSYEDQQIRYAIYDPPADYLFGSVEYEKGALVLHMLRRLLGDQNFFAALVNYANDYRYGNATTEELKAHMEVYYGDLDWFFNEWVYQAGHPEYHWSWWTGAQGPGYALNIMIHQIQSNAPIFTMPITFKAHFSTGADTTVVVWDSLPNQGFTVQLNRRPTQVYFDPENDILKTTDQYTGINTEQPLPGVFELEQNYPNPFNAQTQISFSLAATENVQLFIYDLGGRIVRKLINSELEAGNHRVIWDGKDNLGRESASGVYFYRLTSSEQALTKRMVLLR